MPIYELDWQVIREWITDHFDEPAACKVCGGCNWDLLEDHAWQLRKFYPGAGMVISTGDPTLLVASLICRGCKQVLFFNISAILGSDH